MNYGNVASRVLSRNAKNIKLVDDRGMEWKCTIQGSIDPYDHIKVGGEWGAFVRSRGYGGGTHLMFGSPKLANDLELFVKKH
jgi:hypothetical protein